LAGALPSTNKFIVVTQGSRLGKSIRQRFSTQILNLPKPPPPAGAPRLKITKGADVYRVPIHNLSATTAPTTSNDASQLYTPGSEWLDVTHQNAYICLSNAAGAAVWKSISPSSLTLTGDVTGSGTSSVATTIANSAVTYAKLQQETALTVLGNLSGITANTAAIPLGTGLAFSSGKLIASTQNSAALSNLTTSSSSFANVVGFSFSVGVKEVWSVEFALFVSGSAAGMQFQLTGPASPFGVAQLTFGTTSGITAYSTDLQTGYSSPSNAYGLGVFNGVVIIKATIQNGTTAGNVQLQWASATNTQTNTISTGSYMQPIYITTVA